MRDEPDGAGSEDLVVAGPQVAAHMSEQQAIISELRACGKQSLPKAELLSTPNFQALIVRLGTAQHELRELLKEGSLRPDDAKLLLRQSQLMLQLLSELTEGVDADSHSSGSPPPRYTVDNPQQPIIINTISTTSPVFGVDGKPIIINTIPTTTPVFGADGKPIFNIIPATAINTVPATAISNTVPATTCVFGPDGNPIYMDD